MKYVACIEIKLKTLEHCLTGICRKDKISNHPNGLILHVQLNNH